MCVRVCVYVCVLLNVFYAAVDSTAERHFNIDRLALENLRVCLLVYQAVACVASVDVKLCAFLWLSMLRCVRVCVSEPAFLPLIVPHSVCVRCLDVSAGSPKSGGDNGQRQQDSQPMSVAWCPLRCDGGLLHW